MEQTNVKELHSARISSKYVIPISCLVLHLIAGERPSAIRFWFGIKQKGQLQVLRVLIKMGSLRVYQKTWKVESLRWAYANVPHRTCAFPFANTFFLQWIQWVFCILIRDLVYPKQSQNFFSNIFPWDTVLWEISWLSEFLNPL